MRREISVSADGGPSGPSSVFKWEARTPNGTINIHFDLYVKCLILALLNLSGWLASKAYPLLVTALSQLAV